MSSYYLQICACHVVLCDNMIIVMNYCYHDKDFLCHDR